MFDQYGVDYDVVEADDYANLDQFDTIVLAPGISERTITEGLDPARYPARFHWARGVPDGLAKLRAFTEGGGNLVALGSSSLTAAAALGTAGGEHQAVRSATRSPSPEPCSTSRSGQRSPAAWGMPRSWPVWYYNDPAFALTDDGEVAASYPEAGRSARQWVCARERRALRSGERDRASMSVTERRRSRAGTSRSAAGRARRGRSSRTPSTTEPARSSPRRSSLRRCADGH